MFTQLQEVARYREAIRTMVARDLKVRYSNSALGIVWSFFSPLLMTVVYTLVFTYLIPSSIEKFPVFILAGLLPWNYFLGGLISAAQSITGNGHLITRVYFPRAILPIAAVLSNGVNFLIALSLLIGAMVVFQIPFTLSLLWMPLLLVIQTLLILGLGFVFAAINVYFRDTQQFIEIALLAWFFLTPIVYPLEYIKTPALRLWLQVLNPMAAIITGYRRVLYEGTWPDGALVALTAVQACALALLGFMLFQRLSPAFAEEI